MKIYFEVHKYGKGNGYVRIEDIDDYTRVVINRQILVRVKTR